MNRCLVVAVAVSGVVVSAGCAPIDADGAGYGVMGRVGVAAAGYPPSASSMADQAGYLVTHDLGFETASGVEIDYALPISRGFDMRFVLGFTHWDVAFPKGAFPLWPAGEEATWKTTSNMFLLTAGKRRGRLGLHMSAGPGLFHNTLEWPHAPEAWAKSSFALQTNGGLTLMGTQSREAAFEVGLRTSRAVYFTDRMAADIEDAQLLNSIVVKLGVRMLF